MDPSATLPLPPQPSLAASSEMTAQENAFSSTGTGLITRKRKLTAPFDSRSDAWENAALAKWESRRGELSIPLAGPPQGFLPVATATPAARGDLARRRDAFRSLRRDSATATEISDSSGDSELVWMERCHSAGVRRISRTRPTPLLSLGDDVSRPNDFDRFTKAALPIPLPLTSPTTHFLTRVAASPSLSPASSSFSTSHFSVLPSPAMEVFATGLSPSPLPVVQLHLDLSETLAASGVRRNSNLLRPARLERNRLLSPAASMPAFVFEYTSVDSAVGPVRRARAKSISLPMKRSRTQSAPSPTSTSRHYSFSATSPSTLRGIPLLVDAAPLSRIGRRDVVPLCPLAVLSKEQDSAGLGNEKSSSFLEPIAGPDRWCQLSTIDILSLHHHARRPSLSSTNVVASSSRHIVNPLVATSLLPPVTRDSLRELDLSEILRNPQLRHDVMFDAGLVFRANHDGEKCVSQFSFFHSRLNLTDAMAEETKNDPSLCATGQRSRERSQMAVDARLSHRPVWSFLAFAPTSPLCTHDHSLHDYHHELVRSWQSCVISFFPFFLSRRFLEKSRWHTETQNSRHENQYSQYSIHDASSSPYRQSPWAETSPWQKSRLSLRRRSRFTVRLCVIQRSI